MPNIVYTNSDKRTYCVSFTVAATAQADLFALEAAQNKFIRLQRIFISNPGAQTTGAVVALTLVRTNSAGIGGVVTAQPYDPSDTAFTGTARSAPTALGASASTIETISLFIPSAAATYTPFAIEYGGQGLTHKQPTALLSTPSITNGLSLRHPGASGAAGFTGYVVFTEEGP